MLFQLNARFKEKGVCVVGNELQFSSGSSVMIQHVNSISTGSWLRPNLLGVVLMSLAYISLTAMTAFGPEFLFVFLVLIAASIFCWSRQHYISVLTSNATAWYVLVNTKNEGDLLANNLRTSIKELLPVNGTSDQAKSFAPTEGNFIADLERLSQLRQSGALSEEDFSAAKARVLQRAM